MSISRPRSPSESNDLPEPQLEMLREDLRELPEIVVPEGYGLRNYREGDEPDWCAIMDGNIGVDWTVEKCRRKLVEDARFEPDCLFFATCDGEVVGSACAWRKAIDEQIVGEVHMVAVLEAHRGKRLGHMLNVAVLHRLKRQGFQQAHLQTDDWRLVAIKSYLAAGFQPLNSHESHPERWASVFRELGV